MLRGVEFFYAIMALGVSFAGFTALVANLRKNGTWEEIETFGLRLSLELGVFTVIIGLIPFPLAYLDTDESLIWRLGSLLLGGFLLVEITKVWTKIRQNQPNWPFLMGILLVISGFILTMEFVNALLWSDLALFAIGLLWVVTLSGIQFIAFVTYDRQPVPPKPIFEPAESPYRPLRMRDNGHSNHPDRPTNRYTPSDHNGIAYDQLGRDPNRYSDQRTRFPDRRAFTNTVVRTNAHFIRESHPYTRR